MNKRDSNGSEGVRRALDEARPPPADDDELARYGIESGTPPRANGHTAPANDPPLTPEQIRRQQPLCLQPAGEASQRKRPGFLLPGVIRRASVYTVCGHPGNGKTTVTNLVSACVDRGQNFADLGAPRPGNVLMLAADDYTGTVDRLAALDQLPDYAGCAASIYVSELPVDVTSDAMLQNLYEIARTYADESRSGLALIVIDTALHYAPAKLESENDNMGISRYLLASRQLTRLPGEPCVLILCHPKASARNVPEELVPRGGSAALAASDGNIAVWMEDDLIHVHHSPKMRSPFEKLHFRITKPELVGITDEDGTKVYVPRAEFVSQAQAEEIERDAGDTKDAIVAWLAGCPVDAAWHTSAEIAMGMATKVPQRTLRRYLTELAESKDIEKEGTVRHTRYRKRQPRPRRAAK